MARAEGAYIYTAEGRRLIDGISSWWVNTHGHCHPRIVAAVQEQAARQMAIMVGQVIEFARLRSLRSVRLWETDKNWAEVGDHV